MKRNVRLAIDPAPQTRLEKAFEVLILRSWWVLLFVAFAWLIYSHSMHKKKEALREITYRMAIMEEEKMRALEENEDLKLQLSSQNDPASIELILKKRLGVVPEGQIKVYFEKP